MGIFASITIYLASWILGAAVTIAVSYQLQRISPRKILLDLGVFAVSGVAGFFLAITPVLGGFQNFVEWIASLLTHQNLYQVVAPQLPIYRRLLISLTLMWQQLPALTVAMILLSILSLLALLIWHKRMSEKPGLWALLLGLLLQIFVLMAFFLDRFVQFYMLSIAAIIPVLAMNITRLYEHYSGIHRYLKVAFTLAVSAGLLWSIQAAMAMRQGYVADVTTIEDQTTQAIKQYAASSGEAPDQVKLVWSYGMFSPCNSLSFGNNYTGGAFNSEISKICRNQHEFNPWIGKILAGDRRIDLEDKDWDLFFSYEELLPPRTLSDPQLSITRMAIPDMGFGDLVIVRRNK